MPPTPPPSSNTVQGLYSDHHGWLQAWLQRRVGNAWDAADLAQDTFVRLLARTAPPTFGDEPRALLTHIAKGLVVDRWRRLEVERAYRETIAGLPEPQVPSEETRLLIVEALCRIEAMLQQMQANARNAFLLSQLEGLTYPQIAERLGVSLASVKRYMRDAFIACLSITQ